MDTTVPAPLTSLATSSCFCKWKARTLFSVATKRIGRVGWKRCLRGGEKERKGKRKERKGKERKGKERKGKERKGKERPV